MHHVKAVLSVLYFVAGGPTILYGLVQFHDRIVPGGRWDWVRAMNGEGTQTFAGGSIFSTLGNPNHLGGFLAVLVPIGLVLLMLHTARPLRILTAAIMAGVLVQLLQTASRGALLAALVALGVVGALLWPEVHGRLRTLLPAAGALGTAVVVGAVALAAVPGFSSKLSAGLGAGEALTLRSEIWKVGFAMANDRPVLGHGPDTWVDEAPKYRDPAQRRRLVLEPVVASAPLRGWVLLGQGPRLVVEPVPPPQRLAALAEHLAVRLIPRDPMAFLELATLPAYRINRPLSWGSLPGVVSAIEEIAGEDVERRNETAATGLTTSR